MAGLEGEKILFKGAQAIQYCDKKIVFEINLWYIVFEI